MIKIKCDYLNGAVAVPTDIIDKHLKLASPASFKVLLFILRNPESTADSEQISLGTGLSVQDVNDCLIYWKSYGAISIDDTIISEKAKKEALGNSKTATPVEEEQPLIKTEKAKIRSLPVKKPTQREVAQRISEDSTLREIYTEAQNILGTFGYDTQALILMIHDFYGMPPEVILTLLSHQKEEKKTSSAAIKARAEDWAKRGIETIEQANDELLALDKIASSYNLIKADLGTTADIPTPRIHKFLREWVVEWECEAPLISYALNETNKVLTDANKLLKKWARQGIKTPDQAIDKEKKAIPKDVKKTYDIDNVGRSSVLDWAKKYSDSNGNN